MREFFRFGFLQARACLFPAAFFLLLMATRHFPVPGIARYDLLFIGAVLIQAAMVATKLETLDEVKVICVFHLIGLALEIFKTSPSIHSWSYPDPGVLKILTVPLYSGFMYAAVGSYLCQAWRLMDLELVRPPPSAVVVPLAIAIYANFFTHHFIPDLRWALIALVFAVYARTRVLYTVRRRWSMPLALSFALIGFFVWIAENFSTYWGAWVYPDQARGWRVVSLGKISSWALLVILSFTLVAELKRLKKSLAPAPIRA